MTPDAARDANLAGALSLLLADRVTAAVESVVGVAGAVPAALTALAGGSAGASIDVLASTLRLSHSRTVRVVDALERGGWAVREPHQDDGRRVVVRLSPRGRRLAARAAAARAAVLAELLDGLSPDERAGLTRAAETVLGHVAAGAPVEARALCRLCDLDACGFPRGACPAVA